MKNKKIKKLLVILLAIVFMGSASMVALHIYHQLQADKAWELAAQIALSADEEDTPEPEEVLSEEPAADDGEAEEPSTVPLLPKEEVPLAEEPEILPESEPEPLPEEASFLLELDLNALQEINEDVIGWIHIPDTEISFPLMRSKDNNEYLNLTWDLKYNTNGSIFLERKNHADLSDFHTLIYGHNMNNGAMFGTLLDYKDQSHVDSHPCVYIVTEDSIMRYEVFSSYTAEVVSDTYRLYFEDDARKQSVIDFYLEKSDIESDIVPTVEDRILTLSTCTGLGNHNYRFVVQTVLTGQFPR